MKPRSIWPPAPFKPANPPVSRWFPMCRWQVTSRVREPAEMHLMNIVGKRCISCSLRGCLLLLIALTARANDAQSLDQFLARLGLDDLRLANMERTLARETGAANRLELARKLADAYSEELVSAAEEPERFAVLKSRVEKLLAAMPDARAPAVDVILL